MSDLARWPKHEEGESTQAWAARLKRNKRREQANRLILVMLDEGLTEMVLQEFWETASGLSIKEEL